MAKLFKNKFKKLGTKMADLVADFGGSWWYIIIYFILLFIWIGFNSFAFLNAWQFDAYPFVFLNLILGILASIQAPFILMSSNRQTSRDRKIMMQDYKLAKEAVEELKKIREGMDEVNALIKSQEEEE